MVPSVSQTPKAVWTKTADKKLIEELLVQCQKGKKLDKGFKREVWKEIMMRFNKEMGDEARSVKQIKGRISIVRILSYITSTNKSYEIIQY